MPMCDFSDKMLQLFLSEPSWKENATDESVEQRKALLNELESTIWSLMLVEGRSESRLWLCNAVAEMRSITPRNQRELFMTLLTSKPLKRPLVGQLLRLLFQKEPQKAGRIIAKKCFLLENFFKGKVLPFYLSWWIYLDFSFCLTWLLSFFLLDP